MICLTAMYSRSARYKLNCLNVCCTTLMIWPSKHAHTFSLLLLLVIQTVAISRNTPFGEFHYTLSGSMTYYSIV